MDNKIMQDEFDIKIEKQRASSRRFFTLFNWSLVLIAVFVLASPFLARSIVMAAGIHPTPSHETASRLGMMLLFLGVYSTIKAWKRRRQL